MAKYDIPAIVDAVLEKSGKKNLYYIGHSQGTLIMFTHLAEIRVSKRIFTSLFILTRRH